MITHAYVRYEDDCRCAVVKICDVKGFKAEDDFTTTFYSFKWTEKDGEVYFYRARILLVGESEDDLKRKMKQGRVRVPKIPDGSDSEGSVQSAQADIGSGIRIASSAWQRIQSNTKDFMFVKDLLTAVWSPAELLGRSLQGKHCPRFPDRPRKEPLSPLKVSVIRECYKERLTKKGLVPEMMPGALKQMNRFIVEKLSDVDRMAKRSSEAWTAGIDAMAKSLICIAMSLRALADVNNPTVRPAPCRFPSAVRSLAHNRPPS
ncbi:hypothetical protein HPB50_007528 [Hyalomma asiaticum]|uniref:Uncharacterized protein n=1 Tax=Hyalomma asiaticum TaxID=266040 RepID=A0ACB7SLR7_HYAAI|nr:hypothetical protein HPB50_007528 [Hyalomma asiaticum]